MSASTIAACPACHKKNRVPEQRKRAEAKCGACGTPLFGQGAFSVNADQFRAHRDADLPLVVDFWASWCGPCKQFAPIFDEVARHYSERARFLKVSTETEPHLAQHFAIRSIPTLMIVKNGQEVVRQAGALPAQQFRQWLQHHL
ncbi:thioredoxin TrxC [Pseudidiomarina insulisalsae]|uniref:Thioredoxin n=1 Tax=Pseudidiomarina insulisalsae TaxID=575789 RepID=A0A432YQ01_9GAMM|nr:thioredoxin TrxC [Pseudidiomarina insulisalsae]RUO63143.1 thioredoxin TrxC [Pseudidiomarina insulisalsae]